ncbi:oxidoreductase domain containing protein [Metarhizium acridum CQMa 102]|uniref:Oxidoreductase domain containing protein n=1 Tax=Metarhizium acridum (strain CQMa 102) TaxID=655827 RepID=E9E4X3_METAQ|nr:oxidoreductase domain containing protein [Metarhizium acridum CQMa 102]EFY88990.1 oxidoreductase domain containing protein [Metarhizium acridum CQMa 102]
MVAYLYKDVTIPDGFLAGPSAELVTMEFVDFAASSIPEHEGKTAVVMDNVLSEAECQQYMALAEEAALWAPALVNVGKGLESYIPKHRLSLRIVWDHQGMVALIFSRCLQVPELQKLLSRPPKLDATSKHGAVNPEHWELVGLNNRMRVLKYIKGEYFEGDEDGTLYASFYSIHVYMNDSTTESPPPEGGCVGGATGFYSEDEKRSFDIQAVTGRALIFQQRGLRHSGEVVKEGTLCTAISALDEEYVIHGPNGQDDSQRPATHWDWARLKIFRFSMADYYNA